MTDRPKPPAPDAPAGGKPGTVRVEKRAAQDPALREKICATCGRPFRLTPEQKFYDCPDCYRKCHPLHKPRRKGPAGLLIQIRCVECGTEEYLDFAPPDPKEALCRACFAKQRRTSKDQPAHTPKSRER